MRTFWLFPLLVAACTAPDPAPTEAPALPAPRQDRVAVVSGHVSDATGLTVNDASVRVWSARADCVPVGGGTPAFVKGSAEYRAQVEIAAGSDADDCIVVEASSGGAVGRTRAIATFGSPEKPTEIRANVRLAPAPLLTRSDADRLVAQLARAIASGDTVATAALEPFTPGGIDALRVALDDYRTFLGAIERWRLIDEELPEPGRPIARMVYELRGANGRTSEVEVYQDATRRIQSPLIHYGWRAQATLKRMLELMHANDAERLARLLTSDDIDYPVEDAKALVARYRALFDDLTQVETRFVEHDPTRVLLRYLLAGTKNGVRVEQEIAFRYGDGLLGLYEP